MSNSCTVTVSADLPGWGEYLDYRPDATLFHRPLWGQVMQRAYANRPHYLTARRGGATVGTLQLVAQKSVAFGSHLCSLPYFDAAGIVADDAEAAGALMGKARELMGRTRCNWAELRQMAPLGADVPASLDKVTLKLTLPAGADELWDVLKAKVRNQVRKAQKDNLMVYQGRIELLEKFYAVYARNMRDLGSPPHSRRFFRLVMEAFYEHIRLFVVLRQGAPVAGSFVFMHGSTFRVPWAGSDWRASETCANMLLYWSMLSQACEYGMKEFDFGRSTRDSGTYRFKTQWGAREVQLHWHYLLAKGAAVPQLRADNPKYDLMVRCWRKLPVPVASALGPRIIGKLS